MCSIFTAWPCHTYTGLNMYPVMWSNVLSDSYIANTCPFWDEMLAALNDIPRFLVLVLHRVEGIIFISACIKWSRLWHCFQKVIYCSCWKGELWSITSIWQVASSIDGHFQHHLYVPSMMQYPKPSLVSHSILTSPWSIIHQANSMGECQYIFARMVRDFNNVFKNDSLEISPLLCIWLRGYLGLRDLISDDGLSNIDCSGQNE